MALAFLSVPTAIVIIILAYLVFTLLRPTADTEPQHPVLSLPTVSLPTATSGLPSAPLEVNFVPEEPIQGFSNCDAYGFQGLVMDRDGDRLEGFQIVVWESQAGLLAIDTSDIEGSYLIEMKGRPAQYELWVQIYQNDIPVSDPLSVQIQVDCQAGFQIYEVNWREAGRE